MTFKNYFTGIFLAITLIVAAVAFRVIPHPPNVSPIAALALAGAVYFDKKYSFAIPFFAMVLSDIVIGFHMLIPFVYGSFLLTWMIGRKLGTHNTLSYGYTFLATISSSVLFFVITNFGVWIMGGYPQTWGGLTLCYTMAIPFFRNTLVGDVMYVALLFGVFEVVLKVLPKYTQKAIIA